MATVAKLQKQFIDITNALFNESFLSEQFTQLYMFQDISSPDFVVKFIASYFEVSERSLNEMQAILERPEPNYRRVATLANSLKGSSLTIGALRVSEVRNNFRRLVDLKNLDSCVICHTCCHQLKQCRNYAHDEHHALKRHVEIFFRVEKQIKDAGAEVLTLTYPTPPPCDKPPPISGDCSASSFDF